MTPHSWLEINLARLDANLAAIRALTEAAAPAPDRFRGRIAGGSGDSGASGTSGTSGTSGASGTSGTSGGTALLAERPPRVCGVIKADAYGLGAGPIAQRLAARGIDMLAVYSPAQAEALHALPPHLPILILMRMSGFSRHEPLYRLAVTDRLHVSLHDREQMRELDHAARMFGMKLPVHLYLDTGMSRAGIGLDEFAPLLRELLGLRNLRLTGIYTHLTCAEGDAAGIDAQLALFDEAVGEHAAALPADTLLHAANTCATLRDPRYHRGMVRVGLGLYGYGPEQLASGCETALRPVVRWLGRVVHVRRLPAGAAVGYSSTHRVNRPSVVGLVPTGYADGYPLALSNRAVVGLPACRAAGRPAPAPVLGRVNMDQIVIDLTDAEAASGVGLGYEVELISDDPDSPCALPRLARLADSSPYEMLCRLSPRLPRKYAS